MRTRIVTVLLCAAAATVAPAAQSDLDAFMSQVLSHRDANWKKLQQYVLNEEETFQVTGPAGNRLYGFRREYSWFPRSGFFIRSPTRADGVVLGEAERRRAEEEWLRREQERDTRQRERNARRGTPQPEDPTPVAVEDVIRQSVEPKFISSAYFLRFRFEPGHYALAGRETIKGRDVLRIEYYPTRMFGAGRNGRTGRSGPDGARGSAEANPRGGQSGRSGESRDRTDEDDRYADKMNKVAMITLWVEPKEHQIVRYEFENIDFDFLPGRSLMRLDDLKAAMEMTQPFQGVWLPDRIEMRFAMTLALGTVGARYDVRYHDYRLPSGSIRVQ